MRNGHASLPIHRLRSGAAASPGLVTKSNPELDGSRPRQAGERTVECRGAADQILRVEKVIIMAMKEAI